MNLSRRGFLAGCSAAIAGMAGSRFNTLAFAGDAGGNDDVLIIVFLRGGMDGLSLVPPIGGADRGHYEAARPGLQIPTSGPGAALPLSGPFGLHPSAAPLQGLFQDGHLAIVHGVGMLDVVNKSHFDAMSFVELGTPGIKSGTSGWLTRHLLSASNLPPEIIMPAL
ncbi:MAG: twin-arginine translocation signal domain-containing protein, partial [Acidobacteriota bacterium]